MYEYTIVRYEVKYGAGVSPDPIDEYRGLIDEYAAQGWRFVQIFAPQLPAVPDYYELIFERPRQQQ